MASGGSDGVVGFGVDGARFGPMMKLNSSSLSCSLPSASSSTGPPLTSGDNEAVPVTPREGDVNKTLARAPACVHGVSGTRDDDDDDDDVEEEELDDEEELDGKVEALCRGRAKPSSGVESESSIRFDVAKPVVDADGTTRSSVSCDRRFAIVVVVVVVAVVAVAVVVVVFAVMRLAREK